MKKMIAAILFVSLVCVMAMPAFAFFDNGEIAPSIFFDDVEVSNNGRVKGVVVNKTDQYICLSASILFCDIFNKAVGDAYVSCLDVLPNGKAVFQTVLLNGSGKDAKHAHKIVWIVKRL